MSLQPLVEAMVKDAITQAIKAGGNQLLTNLLSKFSNEEVRGLIGLLEKNLKDRQVTITAKVVK